MVPVLPVEVSESLLPRRYQEEIFSRAQEGNIIAALDTGSGKTFISTLLMKWIAARQSVGDKKVVFLVPKVALVEQQADFITKQTPLRVSRFYGAMAFDLSDRSKWKKELDTCDVLVMTAQIFLNIITHSHWSIDKVSLLVFDECHHTRKNHAYNGIMREYFQWPVDQRPKIFGMTASPIWNPKDAADSLLTLERNMHAKVIAVREHAEELMNHLPKPTEVIVEYPPPPRSYPAYPTPLLRSRVNLETLPIHWDMPHDKIESRYEVTLHRVGPFGAELYLYTELRQRIEQVVAEAQEAQQEKMFSQYTGVGLAGIGIVEYSPPTEEVVQLEQTLSRYDMLFQDVLTTGTDAVDVPLDWCTPQVAKLVEILRSHHSSSFQGIVFVEQRHVALSLAKLLPRIPQLNGLIKSAELVGHGGAAAAKTLMKGMAIQSQQDVVKAFREGTVNLLIATSVAEEGLDFPACDIVIRYDPLQHMVGYVQSRGRARHKTSTFIVMVEQDNADSLIRYRSFAQSEPHLKQYYQQPKSNGITREEEPEEGEIELDDPDDVARRERFVVPTTGAILTYHTAIGLLNHLCSLIPRDKFTPTQLPTYSGDFESILQLPSSLPLPNGSLVFHGPLRSSKKEAKRAVAFMAVKKLHDLAVFDDFLLPAKGVHGGAAEDADGRPIADPDGIPEMMDVRVRDPWAIGPKLWLHVVYVDGRPTAGLVTGTLLPGVAFASQGSAIRLGKGLRVVFEAERRQREVMVQFMRMTLWWTITGRGVKEPLANYLIPISPVDHQADFDAMERAIRNPWGVSDWSTLTDDRVGKTLCMNLKEQGKPLLLRRIRRDLSPLSEPPLGSREEAFATYKDWALAKYTRKGVVPEFSDDDPLVEVEPCPRQTSAFYDIQSTDHDRARVLTSVPNATLLPQALVRWADLSEDLWRTFHLLPRLLHRITDIYRARQAKRELGLPPVPDDLLVEALTLPNSTAGFNNQRFETMGDSVLKLAIVVHLFNRFPHRHEGQLDVLRRNSVSNRTLLARGYEVGLDRFLTSETMSLKTWKYILPTSPDYLDVRSTDRYALRRYPRKSIQDCMESALGASFVAGGMNMALQTGTALGICLGGPVPWSVRYSRPPDTHPAPPLFYELQRSMGYVFHRGELLIEAVTHPSFRSTSGSSYQRLEFLGDALIDIVVTDYLYQKFPEATSGQMSWARSRAVCSPALASVAVKRLDLHKILLVNNVELSMAIGRYVPVLEDLSNSEIVTKGWKYDPPKALSDVLESVMGAILVDTAYDLVKTTSLVQTIMEDILNVLTPNLPRDPISELMIWTARKGCRNISFRKSQSSASVKRNDGISIIVHGIAVVGPIIASNMSLAKGLASERAREVLGSDDSQHSLTHICNCGRTMEVENPTADQGEKVPDDETEEGFAALALQKLREAEPVVQPPQEDNWDDDAADELEVEEGLKTVSCGMIARCRLGCTADLNANAPMASERVSLTLS